jgi:OHCU decarboxylase
MTQKRPFRTLNDLLLTADRIWWSLSPHDWLEAFRSHPKIGAKKAENEITQTSQKWSEQEQSGVNDTAKETMQVLSDLNRQYEKTFGYIFIVCATGKSADEMLSILRERLLNDAEKELRTAAAEQAKITRLRLEKLLNQ